MFLLRRQFRRHRKGQSYCRQRFQSYHHQGRLSRYRNSMTKFDVSRKRSSGMPFRAHRAGGRFSGFQPYKRVDNCQALSMVEWLLSRRDRLIVDQARSAWVAMQSCLRPGGTVEVMVGPKLRSVQSSRWDEAIFLMIPGTSCQATIVLSLRDKKPFAHRCASHREK
jgi:hypothetical protein